MIRITFGVLLFVASCTSAQDTPPKNWPEKLQHMEIGLKVTHSMDTVFATINAKDPENRGKYQMKFATTVESINEDLEIIEFGGYFWENDTWTFKSIYNRPFNKAEFNKWYKSKNGKLRLGKKYSDNDNWLGKSNSLNGNNYKALLYFIAKNPKGEKFVGGKEIVGVMKMKE